MSGRDSCLKGFDPRSTSLTSPRLDALRHHISELSGIMRIMFALGIPDAVVFNALVVCTRIFCNKNPPVTFSDKARYFVVSVRFSIFHRQRNDIMSHLHTIFGTGISPLIAKKVAIAEAEILECTECRIWCHYGNIFEELGIIFHQLFAGIPGAAKLWETSTRLCWIILGSEMVDRYSTSSNIYSTVLVCAVVLLCKSASVQLVTYHILQALHGNEECDAIEVRNSINKLLSYIVN